MFEQRLKGRDTNILSTYPQVSPISAGVPESHPCCGSFLVIVVVLVIVLVIIIDDGSVTRRDKQTGLNVMALVDAMMMMVLCQKVQFCHGEHVIANVSMIRRID